MTTHVSPAQERVLRRLLLGEDSQEIAQNLGLSRATVRNHIVAILRAYAEPTRLKLLARFLKAAQRGNRWN